MPWPEVKITVLKQALFEDICNEYGAKDFLDRGGRSPCSRFQDGQEFILDHGLDKSDNFRPYVRAEGTAIATNRCPSSGSPAQDAMKPVLFKIERIQVDDP